MKCNRCSKGIRKGVNVLLNIDGDDECYYLCKECGGIVRYYCGKASRGEKGDVVKK